MDQNTSNDCVFCDSNQNVALMMQEALIAKHCATDSPADCFIDVLLQLEMPEGAGEQLALARFSEYAVVDAQDQYMKRAYQAEEYGTKITMLSEYYKFHRDVPRVVERAVEVILSKYHNRKREHDYKRIKRILKEEQNLSITSVAEDSVTEHSQSSQLEKKSKYSILLDALNEEEGMSDSKLLKDVCSQINKAFPSKRNEVEPSFKGAFQTQKYFQSYLKKEQAKARNRVKERQRERLKQKHAQGESNGSKIQSLLRQIRRRPEAEKNKFVYNTNIRIEIRNAKFYSDGGKREEKRSRDGLMSKLNFASGDEPSRKFIADVYKSTQRGQFHKRKSFFAESRDRIRTKDSKDISKDKGTFPRDHNIHLSASRRNVLREGETNLLKETIKIGEPVLGERRLSRDKPFTNAIFTRRNLSEQKLNANQRSRSVRRIIYAQKASQLPPKSISAISLKKRSATISTTNLHSASQKKRVGTGEQTRIKGTYASSELKIGQKEKSKTREKIISIQDILSRKLAFESS